MKLIASLFLFLALCQAQDVPREIWDSGFVQKRPQAQKAPAPKAHAPATYRAADHASDSSKMPDAVLGLTVWSLRTPKPKDTDSRLLVYDSGDAFIPERVDLSRPLHDGERIRIGIEVPRTGYLYVVDRERYRDQTFGQPVLLFPSLGLNHGDNRVEPGQLVEIPPPGAAIKSLRLTKGDSHHIGEDLIFVVSPRALAQIVPREGEQALPASVLSEWEHNWATGSMRLDLQEASSTAWTLAEKEAGSGAQARLTRDDPSPAAIFTAMHAADGVILIHLPLQIE